MHRGVSLRGDPELGDVNVLDDVLNPRRFTDLATLLPDAVVIFGGPALALHQLRWLRDTHELCNGEIYKLSVSCEGYEGG